MSDELLRHALTCAERGWHVFPCAPGAKPPAFRGEDWQELSTTDPSRIERWWRARPYNIGVDCGKSGLTVLDLDVPGHGRQGHSPDRGTGMDTLLSLCARQGQPLPDATFTVATPVRRLPPVLHGTRQQHRELLGEARAADRRARHRRIHPGSRQPYRGQAV